MTSTGVLVTTGEGHQSLGGDQTVDRIRLRLTSFNPKQTRFVGSAAPRGVWHAGGAGLGRFPDDASAQNPPLHSYGQFLHSEFEEWWIPERAVNRFRATSVWWRWLAGVTVEIEVFW